MIGMGEDLLCLTLQLQKHTLKLVTKRQNFGQSFDDKM
jgi:hypothetical protein